MPPKPSLRGHALCSIATFTLLAGCPDPLVTPDASEVPPAVDAGVPRVLDASGATPDGSRRRDGGSSDPSDAIVPSEHDPRGYTLFAPISSTATYLIDADGLVVHRWDSAAPPGQSVHLLSDGNLLRTTRVESAVFTVGGQGGGVELLDWESGVLWSYAYASATHHQHHDAIWLPNGHALLIAWESIARADVVAAGRDPGTVGPGARPVWSEHLVEVDPADDTIVWEWHVWDHLVQNRDATLAGFGDPEEHPELVDVSFEASRAPDWLHVNSVFYDEARDQIVLSVHNLGEIWVIDHSTTTEEARGHSGGDRGHGGDLLYRWGNPEAYGRGTPAERELYGQHHATWIADGLPGAGHILLFDNGAEDVRPWSRIVELDAPIDPSGTIPALADGAAWGPREVAWSYEAAVPSSFFAPIVSGAQRLRDGRTLICSGPQGRLFEVTPEGETVWEFQFRPGAGTSGRQIFRGSRHEADDPALAGRALVPTDAPM